MSVVEKIGKIDGGMRYNFVISTEGFSWVRENRPLGSTIIECNVETSIEATYKAVVQFIEWYNENKSAE